MRDSGLCELKVRALNLVANLIILLVIVSNCIVPSLPQELPKDKWFCCDDCNRIYVTLQNSVSNGAEVIRASLADIINRKHEEKGLCIGAGMNDIQWQILSGKSRYPEHLPLLSRAAAIFRVSIMM